MPFRSAALPAVTLAGVLAISPVHAQGGLVSQPIQAVAVVTQLEGEVAMVNPETRMLTIRRPDGVFEVRHVPPEVQRLDRIRIGNRVSLTEITTASIEVQRGRDAGSMGMIANTEVDRSPGGRPAGTIVDTVTLYGQITGVNVGAGTVTVRGANDTRTFELEDKQLLASLRVGDGVVVRMRNILSGEVTVR